MLKMEESKQTVRVHPKRDAEAFRELNRWVAQMIEDAERSGDTRKKAKFVALQAELSVSKTR
jgi:hypothetical protein